MKFLALNNISGPGVAHLQNKHDPGAALIHI